MEKFANPSLDHSLTVFIPFIFSEHMRRLWHETHPLSSFLLDCVKNEIHKKGVGQTAQKPSVFAGEQFHRTICVLQMADF